MLNTLHLDASGTLLPIAYIRIQSSTVLLDMGVRGHGHEGKLASM